MSQQELLREHAKYLTAEELAARFAAVVQAVPESEQLYGQGVVRVVYEAREQLLGAYRRGGDVRSVLRTRTPESATLIKRTLNTLIVNAQRPAEEGISVAVSNWKERLAKMNPTLDEDVMAHFEEAQHQHTQPTPLAPTGDGYHPDYEGLPYNIHRGRDGKLHPSIGK